MFGPVVIIWFGYLSIGFSTVILKPFHFFRAVIFSSSIPLCALLRSGPMRSVVVIKPYLIAQFFSGPVL